ncbi:MAG: hypothetical protein Q9191_004676 [Dirinaria sp. TL-2023a]
MALQVIIRNRYKKLYLGFKDQDKDLQVPGEVSVYKQVFGSDIDERTLKDVNDIVKAWNTMNPEVISVTKTLNGPRLYTGRRPAIKDDKAEFSS